MRFNEAQDDFANRPGASGAADKSKKPSFSRRMSSTRRIPHKGQQFSTDDGLNEVEEDIAQHASSTASPRIRPSRARSPTLHRRPSTRPSPLPRAEWDNTSVENLSLPKPGLDASIPSLQGSQIGSDEEDEDADDAENIDDDDDDDSDADFTLKDRQKAINDTHPFGLRIWKPALYKKNRSVEKTAEGDIHTKPGSPGAHVSSMVFLSNIIWTLVFGWWLALAVLLSACTCFFFVFSSSAVAYGKLLARLALYILYPFGSFVLLSSNGHYAAEDHGEGRTFNEYTRWQTGQDLEEGARQQLFFGPERRSLIGRRRNSVDSAGEHDSLLGRPQRGQRSDSDSDQGYPKRRWFGRGKWTLGRVVFFLCFYFLIGPLMLMVSLVCWLLVFFIPMGRVTLILASHLRRHPLALSFHRDDAYPRDDEDIDTTAVIVCTYRAAGSRYWKYTIDGTNIFFINLLSVVVFVIADFFLLNRFLGVQSWLTHPGLIFTLSLFSIIPLAYFIGQAVASISAQSSMGLGAAINAFFSTLVEVYLYCVALTEGKAQLVEGSLIGSIFAGILFLPGLSMCFGAIKRKTQHFNLRSAGVTSTMLLFAVIAAFGPTLFYQVFGSVSFYSNFF